MIQQPVTLEVPLENHEDGSIRIAGSRVLLEVLIAAYENNPHIEAITEAFPSLKAADVYAIIAYYLAHPAEIKAYMLEVETSAKEIRQKIESHPSYQPLSRKELEARRNNEAQGKRKILRIKFATFP